MKRYIDNKNNELPNKRQKQNNLLKQFGQQLPTAQQTFYQQPAYLFQPQFENEPLVYHQQFGQRQAIIKPW